MQTVVRKAKGRSTRRLTTTREKTLNAACGWFEERTIIEPTCTSLATIGTFTTRGGALTVKCTGLAVYGTFANPAKACRVYRDLVQTHTVRPSTGSIAVLYFHDDESVDARLSRLQHYLSQFGISA